MCRCYGAWGLRAAEQWYRRADDDAHHFRGWQLAIDGSSRAPSLAHIGAIYKDDRSHGYRAATVPSTLATLWYVNKNYGALPWEQILEPAIRLAEAGYAITPLQHRLQKRELRLWDKIHVQPPRQCGTKSPMTSRYPTLRILCPTSFSRVSAIPALF